MKLLFIFIRAFILYSRLCLQLVKARVLRIRISALPISLHIFQKTLFDLAESAYTLFKKSIPIPITIIQMFGQSFLHSQPFASQKF